MREFWKDRIKPTFDKEWALKCAAALATGEEEPEIRVNDRMAVARKVLEKEPVEFQKEVQAAVDKEHTELTKAYDERFELAPGDGRRREW